MVVPRSDFRMTREGFQMSGKKQGGRLTNRAMEEMLKKPKLADALILLDKVGVPVSGMRTVRKLQVGLSLLAAANVRPDTQWSKAAVMGDGTDWAPTQKGFLTFWNEHYG